MKDLLKQSGFSDKEASVYEALLRLGGAPASRVAKAAHINRSTTYVILDALIERGLINVASKSSGKIYSATSPEKLVGQLEKSAKEYSELAAAVKKSLPKIKAVPVEEAARPKVYMFKGDEGMKTVYEDALTSLETIRSYAFSKHTEKQEVKEAKEYYEDLAKKNIKVQVLYPKTGNRSAAGSLLPEISIYDNKVIFASTEEKLGLIIESKELAEALKQAFDLSWKEARDSKAMGQATGGAVA
jgi:HTH-type transcriptional regulator, sugar sensing transcriptional regulator